MESKSRLNIYWTCETCALEIPGEQSKCPNCSRQTEDSTELSWRVEQSGSETVIAVHRLYPAPGGPIEMSTRVKRDNATGTLTVGDRTIVQPSSLTVWLRGSSFEVYGWLEWKVGLTAIGLGDIVIVEGGDVRPADLVSDFARTLARILGAQFVESVEQESGTW